MLSFLVILLLAGTGGWLWSGERSNARTTRADAPAGLLNWATGLLPGDRVDWGQAMRGELGHIESRSRRWRFVLGCVSTVLLLPPWGPVAPIAALFAMALGSALVFGIAFVHFGLATNPWNWVLLAILLILVTGCMIAVSVMLRQRDATRLELMGGVVVAATWVTFTKFTFSGVISPFGSMRTLSALILFVVLPLIVGAASAWRSGSVVGRRAARLAGISAGLVMFFIATIAVLAIDGGPRDPGTGVSRGVSEAFSNVAMLFLVLLPLATAGIGWVAATATERLRYRHSARGARDSMSEPRAAATVGVAGEGRTTRSPFSPVVLAVLIVATVILIILVK